MTRTTYYCLVLLLHSCQASYLRTDDSDHEIGRWLQFGFDAGSPDIETTLLNSLVSYFTPTLRDTLQDTLKTKFDPVVLGNATTQDLGEIFSMANCTAHASIVYEMEVLRGLGTVQLDKMEMVPGGSDNISISLFDGAAWNSTWVLNATFEELNAQANATLQVDACGESIWNQSLSGTATVEQPWIYLHLTVQGETSNLLFFQSTSQINRAQIIDFQFHYHSVDAQLLGEFGNASSVKLGVELGEMFHRDASVFSLLMRDALQIAINESLPF